MEPYSGPGVPDALPATMEREAEESRRLRPQSDGDFHAQDAQVAADPTTNGAPRGGSPSLPLVVRSVRVADLPGLRRVGTVLPLDQPDAQLEPYNALRHGLAAAVPWPASRRRFLVGVAGERLIGFAQFLPVPPDQRWLLVALGAATGVYDAGPVWESLVERGIVLAGLRGVKRLYARLPDGSPAAPALRALGYAPYARETVLAIRQPAPRRMPSSLRPQEQTDTWAIHQLYNVAVPRQVQYAEAFTSHRWDVHARRAHPAAAEVSGWLIEEGHHVIGYARTASRDAVHVVDLVFHPERPEVLVDLLDGALAHVTGRRADRVYCAVRGYHAETETALRAHGFAPLMEQDLLIKYTTATVRAPATEAVPFHVDVREKLPKRVPSFLHGQPRDESAT